jgi:hypothetical protein
MCDKHKTDLKDFASAATEFYRLEEKTGKPYTELVKELPRLARAPKSPEGERTQLESLQSQGRSEKDSAHC